MSRRFRHGASKVPPIPPLVPEDREEEEEKRRHRRSSAPSLRQRLTRRVVLILFIGIAILVFNAMVAGPMTTEPTTTNQLRLQKFLQQEYNTTNTINSTVIQHWQRIFNTEDGDGDLLIKSINKTELFLKDQYNTNELINETLVEEWMTLLGANHQADTFIDRFNQTQVSLKAALLLINNNRQMVSIDKVKQYMRWFNTTDQQKLVEIIDARVNEYKAVWGNITASFGVGIDNTSTPPEQLNYDWPRIRLRGRDGSMYRGFIVGPNNRGKEQSYVGPQERAATGDDTNMDKDKLIYKRNGSARIYLNIPYAKMPPYGSDKKTRREHFEMPVKLPYEKREKVSVAYGDVCPQYDDVKNELGSITDCLTLNVFSPNATGNYPVYFYVHGGLFDQGGAKFLGLQGIVDNLVSRGIVVVTTQYRVGPWGFMRFPSRPQDKLGRSVRGFYDIIMALKWVYDHISDFQGNPNEITIGGHESGACAVGLIALAAMRKDAYTPDTMDEKKNKTRLSTLFRSVIMQSGSLAYCRFGGLTIRPGGDGYVSGLCRRQDRDTCVKNRTMTDILEATKAMLPPGWVAEMQDGYFQQQALMLGALNNTVMRVDKTFNFFMGFTGTEWAQADAMLPAIARTRMTEDSSLEVIVDIKVKLGDWRTVSYGDWYGPEYSRRLLVFALNRDDEKSQDLIILHEKFIMNILESYPIQNEDDIKQRYFRYIRSESDALFGANALKDAITFSKLDHNVYLYKFMYAIPEKFYRSEKIYEESAKLYQAKLAPLGAELPYLFMPEQYWHKLTPNEIKKELPITEQLGQTWANFIKTKRPMPQAAKTSESYFSWLEVQKRSHMHHYIAFTEKGLEKHKGESSDTRFLPPGIYEKWINWVEANFKDTLN